MSDLLFYIAVFVVSAAVGAVLTCILLNLSGRRYRG